MCVPVRVRDDLTFNGVQCDLSHDTLYMRVQRGANAQASKDVHVLVGY